MGVALLTRPRSKRVLAPLPALRHERDMKTVAIMAGLVLAAALAACSDMPELNGTVPAHLESADFPDLIPLEPILAGAEDVQITDQTSAGIAARVSRLRNRAARLKHSVVDQGTRARMRDGVAPIAG